MNPLINIFSGIITSVNRLLNGIDRRTADSIRQGFFLLVGILVILAVVIGYQMGKKAARKGGNQIAEFTNSAFDVTRKKEREEGSFRSMLDSELIREMRESSAEKVRFPSNTALEPEFKTGLIEPDSSERKVTPPPAVDMRDRLSEIDHTDRKREIPDTQALKRREAVDKMKNPDIIRDEKTDGSMMRVPGESAIKERPLMYDKTGEQSDKPGPGRKRAPRKRELKPLEPTPGVLEK